MQKNDVPIAEATTSSLEALKAYSMGSKVVPTRQQPCRIIKRPSNWTRILPGLTGNWKLYTSQAELSRAGEYFRKAYELRGHTSDREKTLIEIDYFENVTGETGERQLALANRY